MASLIGREIGKYRITERIGQGGMAEVYQGVHTYLDKKVAIKVLHSHLLIGGDFVARFKREAKAVANLQHPNIVQVFDFDIQDDLIFMVMQYIEGTTLHARLVEAGKNKQRLPIKLIASIITDIASALDYAHSKSMLHRDIKPSNILIDNDDKAYLADFGIAKLYDEKKFTATGQLVGTPAYMSPEQGRGEDLSEESDIYSLGVVAFEMLTGKVPFDAQTPIGIVLKQINDPVPTMSDFIDDVPGTAQEVIDRALSKSPESRYPSAEKLVGALRVALQALESTDPVQTSIPEDPLTVVDYGLDAPTVAMDDAELEQPTVVMEAEEPSKKEKSIEEEQQKTPRGTSKIKPNLLYIAGGVILLLAAGIIFLQTTGFNLPGIGIKTPSQTSAVEIYQDIMNSDVPTLAPTAVTTGEDLFNQAEDLYDMGLYQDSIEICNQAISMGYETPGLFNLIGLSHLEMGDPQAALETIELAIEIDPEFSWGYETRGRAKHELGDLEGALDDFKIASDLNPNYENFYLHSAWVYFDLRLFDEAFAAVESALEIEPESSWAYESRAVFKRETGDLEGALQDISRALEIDPDDPYYLYDLGIVYFDLGKIDEALSIFERILELTPDYPYARIWRAKIRWEEYNDLEGALEDLDTVINDQTEPIGWAYDIRGRIYLDTGQYHLCIANFDGIVLADPDYPYTYSTRGECYENLGKYQSAREDYSTFLELTAGDPEFEDSRYWIQKSLENLNQ